MLGTVTFTPYISPAELKQITSYNLSCLTGYHICSNLPDLLPAARGWHLYPSAELAYQETTPPSGQTYCAIPIFARARDANNILVVDTLSTTTTKADAPFGELKREIAQVRLVQILKGTLLRTTDKAFSVVSWPEVTSSEARSTSEPFVPGRRYIIFPNDNSRPPNMATSDCGVVEDSPQVREQVNQGLSQNDVLKRQERFGSFGW